MVYWSLLMDSILHGVAPMDFGFFLANLITVDSLELILPPSWSDSLINLV